MDQCIIMKSPHSHSPSHGFGVRGKSIIHKICYCSICSITTMLLTMNNKTWISPTFWEKTYLSVHILYVNVFTGDIQSTKAVYILYNVNQ